MQKRVKISLYGLLALVLTGLVIWTAWANTALELNTYVVAGGELPESFDGFRIAQVSDLHNAQMGKENEKLLAMLQAAEPDMIAITGDLIDSRRTDIDVALQFARQAVTIAPCYYVTGNHEARVSAYSTLKAGLEEAGVEVLENERILLEREGHCITLLGVDDPRRKADGLSGSAEEILRTRLSKLMTEDDGFTVLLSHRPELFDTYTDSGVELVLSGHAHGGQFRLPFVGGLAAPDQGLFPKYDGGLYTEGNTNMVVSRGIGNSLFPFRFNNRPEVVVAELRQK